MKNTLPFLAVTTFGFAANTCAPEAPNCYTQDACQPCYCIGPAEIIANAPVRPLTCDGDLSIYVAGLYWRADEDGLAYAVDTATKFTGDDFHAPVNLIDAHYLTPDFKWNFGFKVGLSYAGWCDGWDLGLIWTSYQGRASSHNELEVTGEDLDQTSHSFRPLWVALQIEDATDGPYPDPIVSEIQTNWNLHLNLVDLALGREFWVSHYLVVKPFIGLRYASLDQHYHLEHNGLDLALFDFYSPESDIVDLSNDFKGVGIYGGLNTLWHLGCGWSIYGNVASSIVYGRFEIDHEEFTRSNITPFTKRSVLETGEHLRVSRAMLDLGLGIEYATLVCDCKYGISVQLGWEQHIFFHQNQLWRVDRILSDSDVFPNNDGENIFYQQRGDLSTMGWTLSFRFDF